MKFKVKGIMTISCWTEVEAETKEEALRIAEGRAEEEMVAKLSGTSFGYYSINEYFHFGDDGVPYDLEVEE